MIVLKVKYIHSLEDSRSPKPGWLSSSINRKLGCGSDFLFWKEKWARVQPLGEMFGRLYQVSSLKDGPVEQMGSWREGVLCWNIEWRRNLFVWESELCSSMLVVISSCQVKQDLEDGWFWNGDISGVY